MFLWITLVLVYYYSHLNMIRLTTSTTTAHTCIMYILCNIYMVFHTKFIVFKGAYAPPPFPQSISIYGVGLYHAPEGYI